MARYLVRRILQMVPTVFGVVLLTFVLFHVVGGSPAAAVFGTKGSALQLEEFDEQRGFNKPLLAGRWVRTRAFADVDVRERPPVRQDGTGGAVEIPLAFELRPLTVYRWRVRGRFAEGGQGGLVVRDGDRVLARASLAGGTGWATAEFRTGPTTSAVRAFVEVGRGTVAIDELQLRRGMDRWWDSQLVFYLRQLARMDFGESAATNQRVGRMMRDGLLPSLALTVPIFLGELILAIALALLCAWFRDSWLDRLAVVGSVALMSVNYIIWIVAGQYLLAYRLGWFPIWGFESWGYLSLPILIGIASGLGANLRFYRTIMLEEVRREYVRTALAKGLGRGRVLFVHVLKNALIPIVTNTVTAIPFLYAGSLLLEGFFGIPGLGGLSLNALHSADVDVVRAVVLVGALLYVAANLVSDLCYAWVDPRVRLR